MDKDYCRHCFCLVEGKDYQWVCDAVGRPIEELDYCPEEGTPEEITTPPNEGR